MSSLLWTVLLLCVAASYAADAPLLALGEVCTSSTDCADSGNVACDLTKKCKLKNGKNCSGDNSGNCVEGAECSTHTGSTPTCACRTNVFTEEPSTGLCKVLPKGSCVPYKNVKPCARNYECILGSCQCPDELYYVNTTNFCSPRIKAESSCDLDPKICVKNATCIDSASSAAQSHTPSPAAAITAATTAATKAATTAAATAATTAATTAAKTAASANAHISQVPVRRQGQSKKCACLDEYFTTKDFFCEKRKKVGATCKETKECWHDVHCIEGRCQCDPELQYVFQDQCFSRVKVNNECRSEIQNECIKNATCVDNYCKCIEGYYLSKGTCQPTIGFKENCNDQNEDKNQCESNTECGSNKKCKCKSADDFFNGEKCDKRVLASFPCPYLPGDQSRIDLDRQCVNNAKCDDTRICKCDTAGYFMRAGYCVPRIGKDEMCDSWSGYRNQCINGLECIYGMCLEKNTQIG